MKRYLQEPVRKDLGEKMVFLGGPRQVGKTTLALSLLEKGNERHPAYLNWDDLQSREHADGGSASQRMSLWSYWMKSTNTKPGGIWSRASMT